MRRFYSLLFSALFTLNSYGVTPTENENIHIIVGPGMEFFHYHSAGFSLNAGFGAKVSSNYPLYLGVDLGIGFVGDVVSYTTNTGGDLEFVSVNNSGATEFHILPTIYYRSKVDGMPGVHTYIGISIGPDIFVQSYPRTATTSTSITKVYFEFLFRPGVEIELSKQVGLLFEPKFGLLRSVFMLAPQLGVVIKFL